MNLLEGLIDTCSTKAAFSPLSDRFHSSKEATYNPGGDSQIKGTGMLVKKLELSP